MLAFSGIENTPVVNTDSERATNLDMAGITEEEGSLVLPDGITLYTKCWKVCISLNLEKLGSFLCMRKRADMNSPRENHGQSSPFTMVRTQHPT